ncbi:hypothetical protein [Streptomyces sp. CA-111067]
MNRHGTGHPTADELPAVPGHPADLRATLGFLVAVIGDRRPGGA